MRRSASSPSDDVVVLIGAETGHLGQSLYQEHATGRLEGAPPPVSLEAESKAGGFVRGLIESGAVKTVHDISDGGLLVALAEMALAGGRGFLYIPPEHPPIHAAAFGEDQARYLIGAGATQADAIVREAEALGLAASVTALIQGDAIAVPGEPPLPLVRLRKAHESWLPRFMSGEL